jgi:hypothetical protein
MQWKGSISIKIPQAISITLMIWNGSLKITLKKAKQLNPCQSKQSASLFNLNAKIHILF